MELALQILLGIVAFICIAGGLNLLLKGTGAFLAKDIPPQPVLDNLFRFLSGIYFGLGFYAGRKSQFRSIRFTGQSSLITTKPEGFAK